jgi:hypothetical protein
MTDELKALEWRSDVENEGQPRLVAFLRSMVEECPQLVDSFIAAAPLKDSPQ